jgi:hypothetical protein
MDSFALDHTPEKTPEKISCGEFYVSPACILTRTDLGSALMTIARSIYH